DTEDVEGVTRHAGSRGFGQFSRIPAMQGCGRSARLLADGGSSCVDFDFWRRGTTQRLQQALACAAIARQPEPLLLLPDRCTAVAADHAVDLTYRMAALKQQRLQFTPLAP